MAKTTHQKALAFLQACQENDLASVKKLRKYIGKIKTGPDGNTPLHIAAKYGSTEVAAYLIKKRMDVRETNDAGVTALHYAAEGEHLGIMKRLIDKGADINAVDQNNETPLFYAAKVNKRYAVGTLCGNHANINIANYVNKTPLVTAIEHHHTDVVCDLIDHMLEQNINLPTNPAIFSPYFAFNSITSNDIISKIVYLWELKGNGTVVEPRYNHSMLYNIVVYCSDMEEAPAWIEAITAKLNNKNEIDFPKAPWNNTAMHIAIANGDIAMAEVLVKKGAALDVSDTNGNTLLHYAARVNGITETIPWVLGKLPNVNVVNKQGETALFYAVKNHNLATAVLLQKHGGDLFARDNDGNTILHSMMFHGMSRRSTDEEKRNDTFRYLLAQGLDINATNKAGETPLHYAMRNPGCAEEFLTHFSDKAFDINPRNNMGNTPLHYCTSILDNTSLSKSDIRKAENIITSLIQKGAYIDVKNDEGNTLLHLAASKNKLSVLKILCSEQVKADLFAMNKMQQFPHEMAHIELKTRKYLIKNQEKFFRSLADRLAEKVHCEIFRMKVEVEKTGEGIQFIVSKMPTESREWLIKQYPDGIKNKGQDQIAIAPYLANQFIQENIERNPPSKGRD